VPNASNTILAVLSNSKNEAIVAMQAPLGTQGVTSIKIAALFKTTQKESMHLQINKVGAKFDLSYLN
jgi:hypothetical protein